MEEIFKKVSKIIKRKIPFDIMDNDITIKCQLKQDLGINSIVFYDLLIDLEHEFGIEFQDVSLSSPAFFDIGTLCKSIYELVQGELI